MDNEISNQYTGFTGEEAARRNNEAWLASKKKLVEARGLDLAGRHIDKDFLPNDAIMLTFPDAGTMDLWLAMTTTRTDYEIISVDRVGGSQGHQLPHCVVRWLRNANHSQQLPIIKDGTVAIPEEPQT